MTIDKKIKYSAVSAFVSLLYFFSFGFNVLTIPLLIVLSKNMSKLFDCMFSHMDIIRDLTDIKDFQYSIIVGQASGDSITETLYNYLQRSDDKSKVSNQIDTIYTDLINNESLANSLILRDKNLDGYVRDFLRIISISTTSGADTKKIGLIEYENMSRRIETELDIWSSYADKRLEVGMMLLIPPMIMLASGFGMSADVSFFILGFIYNVSILIIIVSVCIAEKILKGNV